MPSEVKKHLAIIVWHKFLKISKINAKIVDI